MSNPERSRRLLRGGLLVVLLAATAATSALHEAPAAEPPPAADPPLAAPPAPGQRPRVEVAFVLDATGSMSGLIDGAKRKIWSIANQLASGEPRPEVRMALVAYRDRGDAFVTRARDLTDDIDAVYAELQATAAGGGGDGPESVNQALHEAVTRLGWSEGPGVYRVVFLVGDAPPHMDYAGDVPYAESVRLARQRGIVVNTVQCGAAAATAAVWREIAEAGAGRYAAIRQDGGMVALASPVDDELARLGRELADTMVPYGAADEQAELEAVRERAEAAPPEAAAARLGFLSKLGGRLAAGRADLVDAVSRGLASLSDLDEAVLPAAMRALAPAEREHYVAEKKATRARIQSRIDELTAERDAWIAEETKRQAAAGEGDGFDARVLDTLRDQARSAGIAY